jgi:hypothetical protein
MIHSLAVLHNDDRKRPGRIKIKGARSPVQIGAAREVAKAKGGDVPDIARFTRGQFYVGTDGTKFIETATPMCLSYHPAAPLTEKVIARARADR